MIIDYLCKKCQQAYDECLCDCFIAIDDLAVAKARIRTLEEGIHLAHTTMVEWDEADSMALSATADDLQQNLAALLAALDEPQGTDA